MKTIEFHLKMISLMLLKLLANGEPLLDNQMHEILEKSRVYISKFKYLRFV
jgi:hypothetical protein